MAILVWHCSGNGGGYWSTLVYGGLCQCLDGRMVCFVCGSYAVLPLFSFQQWIDGILLPVVAYAVVVVVVIIIIIPTYIYTPVYESFSLCVCSMDESQANMLPLTFHDKLR